MAREEEEGKADSLNLGTTLCHQNDQHNLSEWCPNHLTQLKEIQKFTYECLVHIATKSRSQEYGLAEHKDEAPGVLKLLPTLTWVCANGNVHFFKTDPSLHKRYGNLLNVNVFRSLIFF